MMKYIYTWDSDYEKDETIVWSQLCTINSVGNKQFQSRSLRNIYKHLECTTLINIKGGGVVVKGFTHSSRLRPRFEYSTHPVIKQVVNQVGWVKEIIGLF